MRQQWESFLHFTAKYFVEHSSRSERIKNIPVGKITKKKTV